LSEHGVVGYPRIPWSPFSRQTQWVLIRGGFPLKSMFNHQKSVLKFGFSDPKL
jgi:hypothetical protein